MERNLSNVTGNNHAGYGHYPLQKKSFMNYKALVDHTLLKSDTTVAEINKVCHEAIENQYYSVCISPYYVPVCVQILKDTPIKVATVIGYPMGYACLQSKLEEIADAVKNNVDELDVVLNVSAVKNGDWSYIQEEIEAVVRLAKSNNKVIKLIFEYELCTFEEWTTLIEMCNTSGTDFVKTSTGNNHYSVTANDIAMIRAKLDKSIGIKASGGIRTFEQLRSLVAAGATRIGTSSAIKIFSESAC